MRDKYSISNILSKTFKKKVMGIRNYTDRDFTAILNVYALSKLDELRFEGRDFTLIPLDQDSARLAKFKESEVFVFDNGTITAFTAIHNNEIRSLFVTPAARGQGIGRQLLDYVLARVAGAVTLNVAKSNIPAITLYRKVGFTVTKEFEASYDNVTVLANTMTRAPSSTYAHTIFDARRVDVT